MEILGHPVEGAVTFNDIIMLWKLKNQSDVNYTWEQSFLSLKKVSARYAVTKFIFISDKLFFKVYSLFYQFNLEASSFVFKRLLINIIHHLIFQ